MKPQVSGFFLRRLQVPQYPGPNPIAAMNSSAIQKDFNGERDTIQKVSFGLNKIRNKDFHVLFAQKK